jgi:hypothetical protein
MLDLYAVMEYVTDSPSVVEVFSTVDEARARLRLVPPSREPFIRTLSLMEES